MEKRGISPNVMPEMLALTKPFTVGDIEKKVGWSGLLGAHCGLVALCGVLVLSGMACF